MGTPQGALSAERYRPETLFHHRAHNQECRARIEAEMANDPELNKRLENARMRQDEYCAKRVEEADLMINTGPRE